MIKNVINRLISSPDKSFFTRLSARLLSFYPPFRAALLAKKGHVSYPLAVLRLGTFGSSTAQGLRERLRDIEISLDAVSSTGEVNTAPVDAGFSRFNGIVVFALHSCGFYDPSGYASRSISLLRAVRQKGVDAFPMVRPGYPWDLTKHENKPRVDAISFEGMTFKLSPESEYSLHSQESVYVDYYSCVLKNYCVETGASVVHASSNYLNGLAAAKASRRLGVRSVYEVRGLWHVTRSFYERGYEGTEHYRYVEMQEIKACQSVDHVITLSCSMASWLVERGIPKRKITIVGNAGMQPGDGGELHSPAIEIRTRYGVSPNDILLGYVGSIVEYEGLDVLLMRLAELRETSNVFLMLVGSGKSEAGLVQLAKKLGIMDRVFFIGRVPQNEVRAYYIAMDMIALPRKEHLLTRLVPAIKPFEAAAHCRPLLVSEPLGVALGGSLPESCFQVVDFSDSCQFERAVFESVRANVDIEVPTWDQKGEEVVRLYEQLFSVS